MAHDITGTLNMDEDKTPDNKCERLDLEQATFFRDRFREARAAASRDAEGFQEIIFVLEQLGFLRYWKKYPNGREQKKKPECCTKDKKPRYFATLNDYKEVIRPIAACSYLASDVSQTWHTQFSDLYEMVREARNDALHQGAVARHLTRHAVELALVLEDALMSGANKVRDFMVRDVVQAYPWQPISFIRQQMLESSFTYLPVWVKEAKSDENKSEECSSNKEEAEEKGEWYLVSDYAIACYLRFVQGNDYKKRLGSTLEAARKENPELTSKATTCSPDDILFDMGSKWREAEGKPLLVTEEISDRKCKRLLGILAPSDIL